MLLPETIRLHDQEKFEFHCIYFLPWKNQLVRAIEEAGGKVTCMEAGNNLLILVKGFSIAKYARQHKIDLIHCHLPWAGFVGRVVFKLSGIPVIYSEHNKQERYHKITASINKITFNWQTEAIAVSEDVKESIELNIIPKVAVKTILNGVNTARFKKEKFERREVRKLLKTENDSPLIGNVAVFRTQKRLDLWLDEAAKIKQAIPNAHFVLIGDGPTEKMVKNKINELGMKDCVHLPGRLEEVRPWLAAMDVFMISSEFEGLPIALLEAMSMEVPIISTNAGGIKEVINHKRNGWLVDLNETDQLSKGVIELLKNDVLRKQLAIEGRSTVENQFSLNRMVDELEHTYTRLMDNSTSS